MISSFNGEQAIPIICFKSTVFFSLKEDPVPVDVCSLKSPKRGAKHKSYSAARIPEVIISVVLLPLEFWK